MIVRIKYRITCSIESFGVLFANKNLRLSEGGFQSAIGRMFAKHYCKPGSGDGQFATSDKNIQE